MAKKQRLDIPQRSYLAFRHIWKKPEVLAASLLINIASLALPFVVLQVYDRMIPFQAIETFAVLMLGLTVVLILEGVMRAMRTIVLNRYGASLEHRTNIDAIRHMLNANTLEFEKQSTSNFLEKLQGIDQLKEFYSGQSIQLVVDFLFAGLFLFLVWLIAGKLVLVPVVLLGVFLLISYLGAKQLRKALLSRAAINERRQNFMIEVLRGIHTVKSTAMEGQILRRYERLQAQSAETVYKLSRINSVFIGLGMTLSQSASIAFVSIGSVFVINNELTIGALAAGTMLTSRVLQPALQGMGVWSQYQGLSIAFNDLSSIFDIETESDTARSHDTPIEGRIKLDDISFQYPNGETPVIRDLSVDIRPGEAIGITGPNGCGKSTLLSLIMGYFEPQSGSVTLDGKKVSHLNASVLRNAVRLMPQQGVIFKGTILENLTLFREGKYITRAIELAQALGLDDIISRLPDGLDTDIGGTPVGVISEGVRQKIVIVRALVGEPKVILFDDANANFDFKNDQLLLDLIKKYSINTTLVIISHRPSYLRICDRVFDFVDGTLVPAEPWQPEATNKNVQAFSA